MENKNILTTEENLVEATAALKAATAELASATEKLATAALGSAAPAEQSEALAKTVVETEKKAEAEKTEVVSEEAEAEIVSAEVEKVETVSDEAEAEQEVSEEATEEKTSEESSVEATESIAEDTAQETAIAEVAAPESKKTGKASNFFFTLIRVVLVAALIAAIVIFVFLRNRESRVPASEVFKAVTAQVQTEKMEQTTDRYFKKYYGLNAADFDDVLYYAPVSNMDAEELLIVKLKSTDQAEALTEAILKRQADKEQSFEGYAPEQYALAQEYILDVQGNYVLFVIDPEAEKIDSAFAGAL